MTPDASGPSTVTPGQVLAATVEVARAAANASSEDAVADAILKTVGALVGADQGTLGLVKDGEVITIAALIPPRQPVGSRFPVGFGVAGWVAATGQPAEIDDVRQDKRYVALPYPEVRSFVGIPLAIDGELLGVLSLAAWRPAAFAPNTAEILAPFAAHGALLLRHAAADRELRERVDALEAATRESLAESLHELKAPLHAAAGFLELVAEGHAGPLNDQQTDFLNTARGECVRLKEALATLVEGAAAAAQRPIDLRVTPAGELVTASVQRARGQAQMSGVCVREQIDPNAQPVRADRAAILQVIANFLQNALRVAPRGSELVVSATSANGCTTFSVADRGPGVPEGAADVLFEPFKQGPNRHAERRAGEVGLGLALSRRIVEQHNGRIWAENRSDGGARFCFSLPTA